MNELHETLRISYDQIAADYAVKNAAMVPAVLQSAERFITQLPALSRILDAGCGHGRETAWFANQGYRPYAYDLSAGMLKETGKIVKVPLIQGNMLRMPFSCNAFTALWCNAAFLHIPKSQTHTCLEEFRRILVSNGLLYLALQAGSGEVWETHSYGLEMARFFARYSFAEGVDMLQSAGYEILTQSENKQGPRAHWLHYIARLMQ